MRFCSVVNVDMYTRVLNLRPVARRQSPTVRSFRSTLFHSFCHRCRLLLQGMCPSIHLIDLHGPKTDRGQFWSVSRFTQRRHSQSVPTTPPENRPTRLIITAWPNFFPANCTGAAFLHHLPRQKSRRNCLLSKCFPTQPGNSCTADRPW